MRLMAITTWVFEFIEHFQNEHGGSFFVVFSSQRKSKYADAHCQVMDGSFWANFLSIYKF